MTRDGGERARGAPTDCRAVAVIGDGPIRSLRDDAFGRRVLASRIAVESATTSAEDGLVIGLCGAWGSGKTSVARMAIEMLEEDGVMVVPFSPWLFSGRDDLVMRFFAELTAKMGTDGDSRFQKIAGRFSDYASAIAGAVRYVPGARTAVDLVDLAGSFAEAASGRVKTLDDLYQDLAEDLSALDGRIVVFIDDIDRLTDAEIGDVVRLVKSVGDLPNLSYILAFDREHVELVLGGGAGDAEQIQRRGRRYLEKIVQVRHDVPPPRHAQLIGTYLPRQLGRPLKVAGVESPAALLAPLENALSGLVRTPRDVNRIANALSSAIAIHGGEIALVDLVGLEALRMLEPDVHARLDTIADVLLGEDWRTSFFASEADVKSARIERLRAVLGRASAPDATRLLLQQLFPAGRAELGDGRRQENGDREDRENRVTVGPIFWRYVHWSIPDTEVSSAEVEAVAAVLGDPEEFGRLMADYHDERLMNMLSRLSGYWENFDPSTVVPLGRQLLAIGTRLPSDHSPFRLPWGPATWQFERLFGRLLISEPDALTRAANLRELVRGAPNMSARMRLLVWFGTFPRRKERDGERELLDTKQTEEEMASLRSEVLAASGPALASEVETGLLLREALLVDRDDAQRSLGAKAEDPSFLLVILRECTVSVTSGSGTQYVFHWRQFVETLGEDAARRAVIEFGKSVRSDDYDVRTHEGIRQAVAIARGEAKPTTMFDDPDDEPSGE